MYEATKACAILDDNDAVVDCETRVPSLAVSDLLSRALARTRCRLL